MMRKKQDMTIRRVKPNIENTKKVVAFFEEYLSAGGAPAEVISQINVAVDEVFSNIAKYSGAKRAIVGCRIEGCKVILRFEDDGKPYDPTQASRPDVTAPASEREIGGLGIHMVNMLMDQVEYCFFRGFNILELGKEW